MQAIYMFTVIRAIVAMGMSFLGAVSLPSVPPQPMAREGHPVPIGGRCPWVRAAPAGGFDGRPAEDQKYVTGINTGVINWYKKLLIEGMGFISDYQHDPPPAQQYFDLPYLADDFLVDKMEQIIDRELVEFSNRTSTTKRASRSKAASKQHNLTPPTIQEKVDELLATSDITDQLYYVKFEVPDQIVKEQGKDIIMCAYMSNRDNFIVDCRENKFDYSDLRRAQFTTMKLCSRMAQECFARKCEGCKKFVFKGFYCYLCPSNPVYCKKCKAEHVQHLDVGLRKFVSPFGPKKLHPSPAFKTVVCQLQGEAQWLKKISYWLPRPNEHHTDNPKLGGKEDAVVVKRHLDLLNKNSDHHDVTHFRACIASYVPLIRHQEFCLGKLRVTTDEPSLPTSTASEDASSGSGSPHSRRPKFGPVPSSSRGDPISHASSKNEEFLPPAVASPVAESAVPLLAAQKMKKLPFDFKHFIYLVDCDNGYSQKWVEQFIRDFPRLEKLVDAARLVENHAPIWLMTCTASLTTRFLPCKLIAQ